MALLMSLFWGVSSLARFINFSAIIDSDSNLDPDYWFPKLAFFHPEREQRLFDCEMYSALPDLFLFLKVFLKN